MKPLAGLGRARGTSPAWRRPALSGCASQALAAIENGFSPPAHEDMPHRHWHGCLTTLLHPNTGDPRSDHPYYTPRVNRSQPVNAYAWERIGDGDDTEQINPNVVPTVALET